MGYSTFAETRFVHVRDSFLCWQADRLCRTLEASDAKCYKVLPAVTQAERLACFHLAYREYRRRGYCEPNALELHLSPYNLHHGARTFQLLSDRELWGTVTLFVDSEIGIPLDSMNRAEIEALRRSGAKVAEVSLLALDLEKIPRERFSLACRRKMLPLFQLFRRMYQQALLEEVSDVIIGVHPRHRALYEFLDFEQIGEVLPYPGARGNPVLPMRQNIEHARRHAPSEAAIRYFFEAPRPVRSVTWQHDLPDVVVRHFLGGAYEMSGRVCAASAIGARAGS
jgi:hypothetical protein